MLTPLMQQTPSSLAQAERLLDEVDRCLLDLLPAGTPSEQQGMCQGKHAHWHRADVFEHSPQDQPSPLEFTDRRS